MKKLDVLMWYF